MLDWQVSPDNCANWISGPQMCESFFVTHEQNHHEVVRPILLSCPPRLVNSTGERTAPFDLRGWGR
jgi:hypothetical protein